MKKSIHPNYTQASAICACGAKFTFGNTVKEIKVDVCSKCHPFYTGKKRIMDSSGRIEDFMKKMKKAEDAKKMKIDAKNKKSKALDELEEIEKEQAKE